MLQSIQWKYVAFIISTCALASTVSAFSLQSGHAVNGLRSQQIEGINKFTSELETILSSEKPEDQFISFTLKGVKAPRKTKKANAEKHALIELQKEKLRGKLREVHGRIISLKPKKGEKAPSESLYIQTTVKYHGATDVAQNKRMSEFRLAPFFSLGSTGLSTSEWGDVDSVDCLPILSAELKTIGGVWKLDLTQISSKKGSCKFIKHKENKIMEETKPMSHDQPKNVLLSPSAPFFQKLGITDATGKPKIARASKLRQCQKFVEIVSRLVDESKILSESEQLRVVDMGCGRGYLTFALHSHLFDKYNNVDVQSRGIDVRPKLMNEVNAISEELGSAFVGLQFLTGTIESAEINDDIDILIALHACDTATDDSLWYGMKKNANVIVSAPCCHKEVRMYLDAHVTKANNHPYADVLRHNIYKERVAETVTDSIRALLLEIADYDVQVFEFIGGEHTSKNVMITAVKRRKPRTTAQKEQLKIRLKHLAEMHGIERQKLADLMDEPIHPKKSGNKKLKRGMPPLE
eukprot:scaffold596_cov227-Chaetoceros_neogracile.AAC.8